MKKIEDIDKYISSLPPHYTKQIISKSKDGRVTSKEVIGSSRGELYSVRTVLNPSLEYDKQWNITEYDEMSRPIYEESWLGGWEITEWENYKDKVSHVIVTRTNSFNQNFKIIYNLEYVYIQTRGIIKYEDSNGNWWDLEKFPNTECPFNIDDRKFTLREMDYYRSQL